MKKLLLLVGFATTYLLSNAQYISNNGFETWTASDPTGWNSPNSIIAGFGSPPVVTKETTLVHTGLNAAKLETKNVFGYAVPGFITDGTITVNTSSTPPISVNGGVPFAQKPATFKGYYTYAPAAGDECFISAALLKKNINTGQFDTVGYAQFTNLSAVSSYTLFQADFTYSMPDFPDTMQIIISSSNPNAAVVGSILRVDDLYLEGGSLGVSKYYLQNNISIFPNPATDLLNINLNFASKNDIKISVYSLIGQKVKEVILPKGTEICSLNIRDLNKGLYFVQIQSGKDKFTQKISKE